MLNYLLEIRRRALIVSACFFCFFLIFFYFAAPLFHFILSPLFAELDKGHKLIATNMTSSVFIPIKLAANTALLCTAPIIFFQFWCFVAPGLYRSERHYLRGALAGSFLLFCLGVIFCFYLILPVMLHFFTKAVPSGVKLMPDMAYALDFITNMLLFFGFGFQLPLVCYVLTQLGWIDSALLKKMRPYIYVLAFIVGMLLTPPDVLSQILLAVPLCVLYELGIFVTKLMEEPKQVETTIE